MCFDADCTISSTPDLNPGDTGYFPLQRDCPLGKTQGILDFVTILTLLLCMIGFSYYQSKKVRSLKGKDRDKELVPYPFTLGWILCNIFSHNYNVEILTHHSSSFLFFCQINQAESIDIAEQTAQDYSIVIMDPNPDATDPKEWHTFFESRFGCVA